MSKETSSQLSDEFKKSIKDTKRGNNFFGILVAVIAIVLVFGTVGLAGYQMLFKSTDGSSKSAAEKIESRPEEKKEVASENAPTPAPAAAAATTPEVAKDTNHTVESGDTWSSIANANGITSAKLMEYNATTDENLQIGQVVKIPKN